MSESDLSFSALSPEPSVACFGAFPLSGVDGVPAGGDSYLTNATQQMTMIATALGEKAKGEELLKQVTDAFASAAAAHPDWSYNSVVYEMNVRQYTPEGTLAEAARHLPRLQEMGVDVVWLMPVYPIGVKEIGRAHV